MVIENNKMSKIYNFTVVKSIITINWLPVWLSSNTLASINIVTPHQARLVPGWVTIFGQVNHLDAEPGTHVYSA